MPGESNADIVMPEYTCLRGLESDLVVLKSYQGAAVYISPDGSDLNDGLSPETAKYSLSAAVQALPCKLCPESTVVAAGYYHDGMEVEDA